MEENKSLFKAMLKTFFANTAASFALAIIGLALSGWLLDALGAGEFLDSGIFALGSDGIAFNRVFEFLGLSIVLSLLLLIFVTDYVLTKYMLVWRYMIFLGCALLSICTFALIFRWFPTNYWQGWVSVLISFTIFSIASMIPTFVKIKKENIEYEKALNEFKMKNKQDFTKPM